VSPPGGWVESWKKKIHAPKYVHEGRSHALWAVTEQRSKADFLMGRPQKKCRGEGANELPARDRIKSRDLTGEGPSDALAPPIHWEKNIMGEWVGLKKIMNITKENIKLFHLYYAERGVIKLDQQGEKQSPPLINERGNHLGVFKARSMVIKLSSVVEGAHSW